MSLPGGHVKTLDGIRGVAIIAVLACHLNNEKVVIASFGMAGALFSKLSLAGATGVDLFFVLSGFLITGILIDTRDSSRFLRNFYARRVLRIFPLYYGTLVLVLYLYPLFVAFDNGAKNVLDNQWWLWTYTNNFPYQRTPWNDSDLFWLGHYWSLAVEEQFYLVWPLVIYSFGPANVKRIIYTTALISTSAALYCAIGPEKSMFTLVGWTTITRSGGLVLGALVSFKVREPGWLRSVPEKAKKYAVIFGALFLGLVLLPRNLAFHDAVNGVLHPVAWVFSCALILLVIGGRDDALPKRLLSRPLLTNFGKYSYGIYVYHFLFLPLFFKVATMQKLVELTGIPILGVLLYYLYIVASVYAVSWLSWMLFERQLLKLKRFFTCEGAPAAPPENMPEVELAGN